MSLTNAEKKLIKNTGILAIGTLLSKVLTFFLLPLYTAFLLPDDFGKVDILQTISFLMIPVVTLQLSTATFRYLVSNYDKKSQTCIISTSTFIQIINCIVFCLLALIINCFFDIKYFWIFIVYFISLMFLSHIQFIVRGFGNNKLFSILSLITTTITLLLNILLIVCFKYNASSILISQIISNVISILIGTFGMKLYKYINFSKVSLLQLKELLKYSLPLIPNDISWWIANASDRLLINIFINSSANGIYAIANKIPQIYTTIFNVYNLALSESSAKEVDNEFFNEHVNSVFSKSIKFFGCICLGIISSVSLLKMPLLGYNYNEAYNHIFILVVAIFINSLCSIIGSILTGMKKTKTIGLSTTVGAIVNIVINLLFIRKFGIYAASISTLVSYIVILIIRYKNINNYIKVDVPKKFIFAMIIVMIIVSLSYFYGNTKISIIIFILLLMWSFYINKELINGIFYSVIKKNKRR